MKSQIPGNHFKFMWNRGLVLASNNLTAAVKGYSTPVLLGLYAPDYLGTQSVIDTESHQIDDWVGKPHSIAGFFILKTPIQHITYQRLFSNISQKLAR